MESPPHPEVVLFRVGAYILWGHSAKQVVGARGGTIHEDVPGALRVRHTGQPVQQELFLIQSAAEVSLNECLGANRCPQDLKPTIGERFVAAPYLRA
jgi:hypothetical protein